MSVAILGGGVAGLSAAHELAERGFSVTVYEKRSVFGGKARSIFKAGTGVGGRKDLPGEHGFRFFPSFYRHIIDTMDRIPDLHGEPVSSHLVSAREIMIARAGLAPAVLPAKIPTTPEDWLTGFQLLFTGIGVPDEELLFFAERLFRLARSCPERRDTEFEKLSWWDYVGAANRSDAYQKLLAQGLTRSLVAMRAEEGATRTVGYILLQLLYGVFDPNGFDRLLSGPTSDVWLTPWVNHLRRLGVRFEPDATVQEIRASDEGVCSVVIRSGDALRAITADYYVSALPIEVMAPLVNGSLAASEPSLARLTVLATAFVG